MGICKCPKRRVTNQYCFTHRVNVCEYCMVTNHPRCIVQSYIYWLEDSDYNPVCEFCTKVLGEEECVRLTCYHIFHWKCAENYYRSLPITTAPAGYQCKTCKSPVFPAPNLISPVADVLKEKLAGVNWARAGLGLPLLPEEQNRVVHSGVNSSLTDNNFHNVADNFGSEETIPYRGTPVGASDDENSTDNHITGSYSVVQIQDDHGSYDQSSSYSNLKENQGNANVRRHYDNVDQNRTAPASFDCDDDKYKRKSVVERAFRIMKNVVRNEPLRARRTRGHLYKRYWMAIILFVIAVVTLLFLLGKMARTSAENDPSLKIMNNPHIRTNDIEVDPSK